MSLLRFKAVCKYWFCLIESFDFILEHLSHSRDSKEDNLIILGSDNNEAKFALVCGSQYEGIDYDIGIGQFWHSASPIDILISCYCDGIICLDHRNEIAMSNPALKQLRPIPPRFLSDRICDTASAVVKEEIWTKFKVSFGFDVKTNDYKLMGILLEYLNYCDLIGNQVELYSLGGGANSWRILHKNDDLPFYDIYTFNAISSGKSGKCFWIACSYDKTLILLSFDFSDDVFSTMMLPVEPKYSNHCGLDFLDDKVVYIVDRITNICEDKAIDIWMLNEFGVEES